MKLLLFCLTLSILHTVEACEKTVIIGVNKAWPPYVIYENGKITGLDVETIHTVFDKVGFCAKFRHFASSKRALVELQKGTIHMLKAASFTAERAQIATFSKPYRHENLILFHNKDSFQKDTTIDQLFALKYSFALSRGAYYGEAFSKLTLLYPNQVKLVSSANQRFGLVEKSRVSFTIEDELTGNYFLAEKGLKNVFASPLIIHSNPVHFMFHRTFLSNAELKRLDQAILDSETEISYLMENFLSSYSNNKRS